MITDQEFNRARTVLAEWGFERMTDELKNNPSALCALEAWKIKIQESMISLRNISKSIEYGKIEDDIDLRKAFEIQFGSMDDLEFKTWKDMVTIFM